MPSTGLLQGNGSLRRALRVSPADALLAVVPLPLQTVDALALELGERVHDRLSEQRRHIRIGICSDVRVRYYLIDDVKVFQFAR